jgi:hypothetical protein
MSTSNVESLFVRLLSKNPAFKLECAKEISALPEEQRADLFKRLFSLASNESIASDEIPVEEMHKLPLVYSAADALEPQPPLEWVLENLIPACSVGMLVGAPGSKKTYSLLDLAVKVSTKQDWLGFKTTQSNVLILDEESGPNRVKRRLSGIIRAHSGDASLPIYFTSLAHLDLRKPNDLGTITQLIQNHHAKLVILDALADFMLGGDENAVQDVQPVFQNLRLIAEVNQCAIIVIHHVNKNGGYRGSSAILGAVDFLIKQISAVDSDTITFETEKLRDGEPVTFHALIHFGDEETVWLSQDNGLHDTETKPKKALNCANSILALLETKGNLEDKEVIKALDVRFKEATIITNLFSLRRSGKLSATNQPLIDGARV